MINRIKKIFLESESNRNLVLDQKHLAIFLSLVSGSSLVEIAYFTWIQFGYMNPLAIVMEPVSLFAGFILILAGLAFNMAGRMKILWTAAVAAVVIQILFYAYPSGLKIYSMIFMAVLFITLFTYVIIEERKGLLQKFLNYYTLEIMLFLFIFAFLTGFFYTRYFPSDESAIDTYAASLFLRGINPYNAANMVNSLSVMHFPYYLGTPLLTGGYVRTLGYPVLSFIAYLPTAVFSLKPSFFQETLSIIPVAILVVEYIRKGYLNLVPALFLGLFSSTMILSEGLNGGNGFFWASLVMISYIFTKKPAGSGIFFGLALSVKQIPVFVLPFFLVLILKEQGKSAMFKWLLAAMVTFLLLNGYFIALNPSYYVKSVLSPELFPILGIGFGISQISFLGMYTIPETLFPVLMICMMFVLGAIYFLYFDRLKYAIFVFPMIILAFNYRVAIEYFLYWVILCFSTIPFLIESRGFKDRLQERPVKKKSPSVFHLIRRPGRKGVLVSLIIVLCIIPVSAVLYHDNNNSGMIIESAVPNAIANNTSFSDSMNLTVYFTSASGKPQDILVRIVEPGAISNGNGLIWNISGSNNTIMPNSITTINLRTDVPEEYLNLREPYRIVVYCYNKVYARTFD